MAKSGRGRYEAFAAGASECIHGVLRQSRRFVWWLWRRRLLNDTWVFQGDDWSEIATSTSPTPRSVAMMTTFSDALLLFGGGAVVDGSPVLDNDTWTFEGSAWTELSPGASPQARSAGVLATVGSRIVLFGGLEAVVANDMWTYGNSAWSPAYATGPDARRSAAAAALGSDLVLFGGATSSTVLNDTWILDGSSWTPVSTSNQPAARYGASMASAAGEIVLFGGQRSLTVNALASDTWIFDGVTWTLVCDPCAPGARWSSALATKH